MLNRSQSLILVYFIAFSFFCQFASGTTTCSELYRNHFRKTPDLKSQAELIQEFSEEIKNRNKIDVLPPLLEGIRFTDLSHKDVKNRLYNATRLTTIPSLFLFLKKISRDGSRELIFLDGSTIGDKLAYFCKKAKINYRKIDLSAIGILSGSLTLLISPVDVTNLLSNADGINGLEKMASAGVNVLISDQIENGITPFNYSNSKAIAASLLYQNPQRVLESRKKLSDLNTGVQVDSVFFDQDLEIEKNLIYNSYSRGSASTGDIDKLLQTEDISTTLQLKIEMADMPQAERLSFLSFAKKNVHLESLAATNSRIGRMLLKVAEYTKQHSLDDVYFYGGPDIKSSNLIKRILMESYGVTFDHFLPYRGNNYHYRTEFAPKGKVLVLAMDDFIGSGDQMKDRLDEAILTMKNLDINGELHVFSPLVAPSGKKKIEREMNHVLFFDRLVSENVTFGYSNLSLPDNIYKGRSTAVFFQYMAPDNNVIGLQRVFDFWTEKNGFKSK